MKSDNEKLRKEIADTHNSTFKRRGIRLPSKIDFFIDKAENKITMKLSSDSVCINMQSDSVAFEGWALVIKHWTNYRKFIIEWDEPSDVNNEHYQRFLFRVKNFKDHFGSWFSVANRSAIFIERFAIIPNRTYLLNLPEKRMNIAPKSKTSESALEFRFADPMEVLHKKLRTVTNANFIERQLPVGVFSEAIANQNAIFPGRKSAIDLWGINPENELLIFELKKDNNYKVGIISELYFYVCVMSHLRNGIFRYESPSDNIGLIGKTKRINAYFLSPELHPLIENRNTIIDELNSSIPDSTFRFIKFDEKENVNIVF